jgi:hypothetical protein
MKPLQSEQLTANSCRRYVSSLPPFDVLDEVLCNLFDVCGCRYRMARWSRGMILA